MSVFSLAACNPYDVIRNIVGKMQDTQKYTMEVSTSGKIPLGSGEFSLINKVDVDKIQLSIKGSGTLLGFISGKVEKDFFYVTDNAGVRKEYTKNALGKWDSAVVNAQETAADDYATVDFDWDKFTKDYFDQTGSNELTLKKEKYNEFFPITGGGALEYFKVTASGSSMGIEYSIKFSESLTNLTKISIKDVGKTTVTLPE